MSQASSVSQLHEDNVENVVVHTVKGYEWVLGLHDSRVDGRKLLPHTEDGELVEMVSAMGNYYNRHFDMLKSESYEILGYASNREEAASIATEHYQQR